MSKSVQIRQILERDANTKPSEIISELAELGVDVSRDLVKKVRRDWRSEKESVEEAKQRQKAVTTFEVRKVDFDAIEKEPPPYRRGGHVSIGIDGPVQSGVFFQDLFIQNFASYLNSEKSDSTRAACFDSSPIDFFQNEAINWLNSHRKLVGLHTPKWWDVVSDSDFADIWIQYAAEHDCRRGFAINVSLIRNDLEFHESMETVRRNLSSSNHHSNGFGESNSTRFGLVIVIYSRCMGSDDRCLQEQGEAVTKERFRAMINEELGTDPTEPLKRLGRFQEVVSQDSESRGTSNEDGIDVRIGLVGRKSDYHDSMNSR